MSETDSTVQADSTVHADSTVTIKRKNKSPGRVAWGKKLAVISSEAKKRKKSKQKEYEIFETKEPGTQQFKYTMIVLSFGSLLIGAATFYFNYTKKQCPIKPRPKVNDNLFEME